MLRTKFISLIRNGTQRVLSVRLANAGSRANCGAVSNRTEDLSHGADPSGAKGIDGWQIMAAVCITRHPVLCPEMSPLEDTYTQHLSKIEVERSLQSDFELQIMEENAKKVLGEDEEQSIDDVVSTKSALEQLDDWKQEHQDFEYITNFNYAESAYSVGSSLSRQVVLVQKHQLGSQEHWLLPQGPWNPGETLRQTGERVVTETVDPALGVRIMGNAPVGFYKYKYPKEVRANGYIGAKVFFYRGHVSTELRKSLKSLEDIGKGHQMWLTHEQMRDCLKSNYVQAVSQFLIDDS